MLKRPNLYLSNSFNIVNYETFKNSVASSPNIDIKIILPPGCENL